MAVMRTPQEHVETLGSSILDTLTPLNHDANAVDLKDTIDYIASQLADITGKAAWEDAPDASLATIWGKTFLDEKLALRELQLLTDITVPSAVKASGILTLTGNALNTETVTIGSKVYTFQDTLTDVDGNVKIGATASDTLDNLIAAINLGAGAGTLYAASMTLNADVDAAAGAGDTMDVAAKKYGTYANSVATTDTLTNGSWGSATLTGGAGDMKVLSVAGSEVPAGGNNIKAIGAGTVEGLITATVNTFAQWASTEVSGDNALSPKNLLTVVDGETGDPILDSAGQRIWALLQNETGATDNAAFTDTTPERAQVSFVAPNTTSDDLVHVDGADIGGKTIHLGFVDRKDLDSWTEQDFLKRSAFVDIGAGAAAGVNLDNVIDNQSTTPATQSTDIYWRIDDDDDLNFQNSDGSRNLLKVAPAAAGDEVEVNVDTFDVNVGASGVIDFDNGMTVDSAGQAINVGVTAGQIDSTALKLAATTGAAEVEGVGVTLDALVGAGGPLTADATLLDLDVADNSHLTMRASDAADKTLEIMAANDGAGASILKLASEDGDVVFQTALETTPLPLDDSTTGKISTLFSQTFDSIAAAIAYAGTVGGVDLVFKRTVFGSAYAQGANVPAATLDLTAYQMDLAAASPNLFLFLNGRILDGADQAGDGDVYPGDTPASGDLKFDFPGGIKVGWKLFSIGLLQ